MQKNKKFYSKILEPFIFSLFLLGFSFLLGCDSKKNIPQEKTSLVYPQMGDISLKVVSTGTLSPLRRIEVKASEKGRVEKIFAQEGHSVRESSVLALISPVDRIALMDTARASLYEAQQAKNEKKIKDAQLALKVAQEAYQPVPIVAPVSGEIIKKDLEIGELVASEKTLFVVSDRLVLRLLVNEADIGKIKVGQKVSFTLESFPEEEALGTVYSIAREGQNVSNVIQYEVLVTPNVVQRKWIAGMTVNAWFVIKEKKGVLTLPLSAVKRVGIQPFVVIQKPNKTWELRQLVCGHDDFQNIEIIEGIEENEGVLILSQSQFNRFYKEERSRPRTMRLPRM